MKQLYSRNFAHFRTISLVLFACLTLQLSGPVVYAMQSEALDYSSSEEDYIIDNDFRSCTDSGVDSDSDSDSDSGYDSDYDSDEDSEQDVSQNSRQSFFESDRTFLWWIKVSLLLMLCFSGIYLPVVQAVSLRDVNPRAYDVCEAQEDGTVSCLRLGRMGVAYVNDALTPEGQCWSTIPGSAFNMRKCVSALNSEKIEVCSFKQNDTNAPYLCKTAIMNGLPSNSYSQGSNGVFIKNGLTNVGSAFVGRINSLIGGFVESSKLAHEIQTFKSDDGTCKVCLISFGPDTSFTKVVDELVQKLQIKAPHSLDFSCNERLCNLIKEKSPDLMKITDGPMKGFIAHSLAHERQPSIAEALPVIGYRYSNRNIIGTYVYTSIVSYPWFSGSSPELAISEEGVDILKRINIEQVSDLLAGLATGKPEELARGYALLINMQPGRSEERIYVSPDMKLLDLSQELLINPNPLSVRPTNEAYIVALLLEQREEVCRIMRELEDARRASGGMTNFKVDLSRLFNC